MITLERFAYLPYGTVGRISALGIYTLELPWKLNKINESCIPEGIYSVKPDNEGRFTGHPELQNVPGRSEIIIHPANHTHELEGCIAPGLTHEICNSVVAVWDSRKAYQKVLDLGDEFYLKITSISA